MVARAKLVHDVVGGLERALARARLFPRRVGADLAQDRKVELERVGLRVEQDEVGRLEGVVLVVLRRDGASARLYKPECTTHIWLLMPIPIPARSKHCIRADLCDEAVAPRLDGLARDDMLDASVLLRARHAVLVRVGPAGDA